MFKMARNNLRKIIKEKKDKGYKSIAIYFILRFCVILCLILQLVHGDLNNAFFCLITLILLLLPFIVQERLKIELPSMLESIILFFIFSAEILGEINNFYNIIPFWDTILHTINGFLAAAIGFALVDLLNKNSDNFNLSPIYLCLVAFCFSMTIGILWEFFEFSADRIFKSDMQKDRYVSNISSVLLNEGKHNQPIKFDNIGYTIIYDRDGNELYKMNAYLDIGLIDTMKDLMVNFVGAAFFCSICYISLTRQNKYKNIITNLTPKKGNY